MTDPPSADLVAVAAAGMAEVAPSEAVAAAATTHLAQWLGSRAFRSWHPQLHALIERERWDTLLDSFYRVLPFGTGGRRGPVGVGPNRFNPWTLGASVQGHVSWLRQTVGPGRLAVVVGHDVRCFQDLRGELVPGVPNPAEGISSRDFAHIAAEVYAAAEMTVYLPPEGQVLSTPELSFAIRALDAAAGLQITASHNPPDDNGGKFYGPTGGQQVPPQDEQLGNEVEAVEFVERMSLDRARAAGLVRPLPDAVVAAYRAANLATARGTDRGARVVFTPLHGTGTRTVAPVLAAAGFQVDLEPSQSEPDGAFSAAPFRCPNPEVPAALDAATATAQRLAADLVLACDPDADRIGLSARERQQDPSATDPERWRFFSGNEIAALVCHQVLRTRPADAPRALVYKTEVTSSLVSRVAALHGAEVAGDLLVGFKYVGAALDHLEAQGDLARFAVGVEESHGVLTTPALRDKDAAGAAVALAELASHEKARGRTLVDALETLWDEVGYVANVLRSAVLRGAAGRARIEAIQRDLRSRPFRQVGGRAVLRVEDRQDTHGGLDPIRSGTDAASRDVLVFTLEGDARVVLRPSGTEPKTKVYVEVAAGPADRGPAARRRTDQAAQALAEAVVQAMLARVDVHLPRWTLGAHDLVSVEHRLALIDLMPEVCARAEAATSAEELAAIGGWLDGQLRPLGAEPRRLVAGAVRRWVDQERPAAGARVLQLFRPQQ